MTEPFRMVPLIERKKRGEALSAEELGWLLGGFLRQEIPEYQVAAWLMAVWFRGMEPEETLAFTRALVATGGTLDWSGLDRPVVDKHSTGGVGGKTSLVLVPLLAALGVAFAKMSGRGLGHTGGTLDKLESIPGFRVDLPPERVRAQVAEIGCALVGQSRELVPGDGALYALRDVTGTVDSIPLIASSIMSKKLAGGAESIVLDVKHGSGAFMHARDDARTLARTMVEIGRGAGRRVTAVLNPMDQPLGRAVGNSLEVAEAIATLRGQGPPDLWALTLELGVQLLRLSGVHAVEEQARAALVEARDTGAAADRLARMIEAQGGDPRVVEDPARLPTAPVVVPLPAPEEGWVASLDARGVAEAALELGAGRRRKSDSIDLSVGVVLGAKTGERTRAGEPLAEIHAASPEAAERAGALLLRAFRIGRDPVPPPADPGYEVISGG